MNTIDKIIELCEDSEGYMLEAIKPWSEAETVLNDFIQEIYNIIRASQNQGMNAREAKQGGIAETNK